MSSFTKYHDALLAELEDLAAAEKLGAQGRETVMLDQQSVGRLSRMDALQSQAMANAQSSRRGKRLRAIEAALQRLEAGEYGFCADCEEAIEDVRLSFDPTIRLCLDCQRG
ncbi:MAG: TraR/DksA C4-type zinc finger protein [Pseudomonadota bacterium]